MINVTELIKSRAEAQEKYLAAMRILEKSRNDPVALHSAAQEANDAWIEFKKVDVALSNYSTMKKLGDLYGC